MADICPRPGGGGGGTVKNGCFVGGRLPGSCSVPFYSILLLIHNHVYVVSISYA